MKHGFADLPHEKGSFVESSSFRCLGHEWCLKLYPRGDEEVGDGEEQVSLHLLYRGDESITIEYSLNARGASFEGEGSSIGRAFVNFIERDTALTSLVKGALVIVVTMKEVSDGSSFFPCNSSTSLTVKHLFIRRSISGDVMFEIGEGAVPTCNGNEHLAKKQRSSTTFYAHRCILMIAAPHLAELCSSSPDDKSPLLVPLHNVPAHAFEALLRYIYGYNVLHVGKDIVRIQEILETADRFDVVNLKVEAEALLISSISLDIENAIDHYLYAESKSCAALKEKVLLFIVKNLDDIYASNKVQDIPGLSFARDMLIATKIKHNGDGALDTWPIALLRRKADGSGLRVDGSRETLISLLK